MPPRRAKPRSSACGTADGGTRRRGEGVSSSILLRSGSSSGCVSEMQPHAVKFGFPASSADEDGVRSPSKEAGACDPVLTPRA